MSNVDFVKRGMQAYSDGDVATLDQLVADDFVLTGAAPQPLGKAELLGLSQAIHTAFPDFDFHASNVEEDGDVVTLNVAITGTHTGPLALVPGVPAVPATGKRIQLPEGRQTQTVRDGRLVRLEVFYPGGGIPAIYAQVGAPLPRP